MQIWTCREKNKITYKVCFPLKINEEVLPFDNGVRKGGYNKTAISSYQETIIFYTNCSKNMLLIAIYM